SNTPPLGNVLTFFLMVSVNGSILAGTIAILSSLAFNSAFGGFVRRYWYDLLILYLILNWYSPSPSSRSVCQDGHRFAWYSNSRVPTTVGVEMPRTPSRPYQSRRYAEAYDKIPYWLLLPFSDYT